MPAACESAAFERFATFSVTVKPCVLPSFEIAAEVKSPAAWFACDGVTTSCEYGASASPVGSVEEVRTTARLDGAFSVVPPFDGPAIWVTTIGVAT